MNRREFLQHGMSAAALLPALASTRPSAAAGQTPTGTATSPLEIGEWSWRFVGVETVSLARGEVVSGRHIYVEYQIPAVIRHPYSVVFVHGGAGQGLDWMGTPDGRRGWATELVQAGYKVYVVDRPGQGRNPYHPYVHGNFRQAPTYESAARTATAPATYDPENTRATLHTQWPGTGEIGDAALDQFLAARGQAIAAAAAEPIFRSRGAMLLDDIGPAVLVSHGDGSMFAWVVADERSDLVEGVVALEPAPLPDGFMARVPNLSGVPVAVVTGEASRANESDPATVATLRQAGARVDHLQLAARGIRGNGPFMMLERNSLEVMQSVVQWVEARESGVSVPPQAPAVVESLALSLADQGHFWVGVQRKQTPYGTIAMGQSFVQYFIPRQVRHRYPVVLIHGGAGQATHMMGIGRRPGFAHYFIQDGYQVYVMDRPGFGRVPYHPDSLGPSHLQNFGAVTVGLGRLLGGPQGPGRTGLRGEDIVTTFAAFEAGNVTDLAFHSELFEKGIGELLARTGPAILLTHAYSGTLGWLAADRNPTLVRAHFAAEVNFNPFEGQTTWGLTALPVAYDPPVSDPQDFRLVDVPLPPDSPGPANRTSFKLQAEPARQLKNLQGIPMACLATERYPLGSGPAQVAYLKQAGCTAELIRLRDLGIQENTNLFILEKNNKDVFGVIRDWLVQHAS